MDCDGCSCDCHACASCNGHACVEGEAHRVYVSHAWEVVSSAWLDQIQKCLPSSLTLVRDNTDLRPGEWISTFMRELARAHLVIVVLSEKYLRSRHCMRELLHLRDRSVGDRADLMRRTVPLIVGDLKISGAMDRLQYVLFWKERHDQLEAMINRVGITGAGGPAREELLQMKDFQHRTDELLDWLGDVLMPRGTALTGQTIQTVINVLLERAPRADVR